MGIDSALHLLGLTLEVFLIDVLLSGDNAVVIAMACRRLPPEHRRQVLILGTGIAAGLRVVLTLFASLLLRLPMLKLVGSIALIVIAVRLLLEEEEGDDGGDLDLNAASALRTVVVADVVMSLDNVMGLAGLAQNSVGVLVAGVVFSVPLLMFGSWFVARALDEYPLIEPLGAALLGWIAGSLAVSDPLYATWVQQQSPLLAVVVPALTAFYVLAQARIVRERRPLAAALRPAPVVRAAPITPVAPVGPVDIAPAVVALVPSLIEQDVPIAAPEPDVLEVRQTSLAAEPTPGRSVRGMGWIVAGGVTAAVTTLATLLYTARFPAPVPMNTYDCAGSGMVISYVRGGSRIRLATGSTALEGTVRPSNQIDWQPPSAGVAGSTIVLPRFISYADATRLGLGGAGGAAIVCSKR